MMMMMMNITSGVRRRYFWTFFTILHVMCVCESVCINPEPISIDRLTKRNLNQFIETLKSDSPLFCIDASLSTPYIILQPSGIEVYNTIMEVVKGFLERYIEHF